jgi:RNA polymerase sigma-54 factor
VAAFLSRGLGLLAHGGVGAAATASGLRPDELRSALDWIRAHVAADPIEPEPGAPPAPVDMVVRRDGDRLVIDVVPGPWSAVRVAESYLAAAADPLVRPDIVRARRFVDELDRRTRTMLRVADVVITHQSHRVIEGPAAHRPLLRRDVAAELDLHESTVSRVVAGKHLLLPSGETVPFGALFGAARGVQECLRDLVAAETVAWCDAQLVGALAERGHRVSRRTVAKYRAVLGIPCQRRR